MFKKILLCIDLSQATESLVGCISELKKMGMEEIILAHVIYVANTPGLEVMLEEEARPILDRHKTFLEAKGFQATVEMPFGVPAHILAEIADKHDVSLVVVGSHSRGIVGEAVMGRVAGKLFQLIRRPVLRVPLTILNGGATASTCRSIFDNILFPSDFSETAEHALDYVAQIAAETKSPVTLLHVYEDKHIDEASRQSLEDGSQFFAVAKKERLQSRGVSEVSIELTFGDPADEIITKANKGGFSLVVMGSQGKGLVKEAIIGSVSNKVVRQASLPVLLIPTNS